jgi:hypothetical protein
LPSVGSVTLAETCRALGPEAKAMAADAMPEPANIDE